MTKRRHGRPMAGANPTYKSFKQGLKRLGDMRLNKSGTVGTEPVAKKNKHGGYTKGTDIKLGKLGNIFIPHGNK